MPIFYLIKRSCRNSAARLQVRSRRFGLLSTFSGGKSSVPLTEIEKISFSCGLDTSERVPLVPIFLFHQKSVALPFVSLSQKVGLPVRL